MLLVYPAYKAVFSSLGGNARLSFVLLLPVIKHGLKRITMKASCEFDDVLTTTTVSVEVFHVLYMTKCMQSARTLVVGVGIIVLDMAQNCAAILKLSRQTRALVEAERCAGVEDISQPSLSMLPWATAMLAKNENCD